MKRGDVVLIRFPFSDLSGSKVRPAIVVSADSYTQNGRDAIFVVISSNTNNIQANDILVDSSDSDFPMTGLSRSSLIRIDKIVILDKDLARRKLGEAIDSLMEKVNVKLIEVLGLANVDVQPTNSNVPESVEQGNSSSASNVS